VGTVIMHVANWTNVKIKVQDEQNNTLILEKNIMWDYQSI
jgi:hypothetical protein